MNGWMRGLALLGFLALAACGQESDDPQFDQMVEQQQVPPASAWRTPGFPHFYGKDCHGRCLEQHDTPTPTPDATPRVGGGR